MCLLSAGENMKQKFSGYKKMALWYKDQSFNPQNSHRRLTRK